MIDTIRIADPDGDGSSDVVARVWRRTRGDLLIFPGLGNRSFGPPIVMQTGYTPSDIAIADFDLNSKRLTAKPR
jgi:VCBS repeat protein